MSDSLRIAVVSDLHCKLGGGKPVEEVNTYLTSDILTKPTNRNPVESLKKLIKEKKIETDLLICPGDITDKIDISGLTRGWEFLQQIATALHVKELVATVGNHDVDPHNLRSQDAFDAIQRLSDEYPTANVDANKAFWAKKFCIINNETYLILIINSCFNHTDPTKAKASQITDSILEDITNELQGLDLKDKFKVALMHHHPMHHSNMDYKDGDFVDKSDILLKLIDRFNFDICIHGHKHDPRLDYKNSIAVFGAGTFSSTINLADLKADNTFHVITMERGRRGTIESWLYSPKDGWKQKADSYFPCATGYGYRPDIIALSNSIAEWFSSTEKEIILFNEVTKQFPNILYLIPDDQDKLNEALIQDHNLQLVPTLRNTPTILSKLYL